MRKITQLAVNAFMNNEYFKQSNTEVGVNGNIYLHGNHIVRKDVYGLGTAPVIYIRTAGWNTRTTRERLNGIPGVHVQVKKGILYLNGKIWDGTWAEI